MIGSKSEIVDLLTREFTVEKIMISKSGLIIGDSPENCSKLSGQHPDFDIIPFSQNDVIMGYWEKKHKRIIPISPKDLITSSTDIFKLIDLFEKRMFYFVMKGTEITGYLHRVDLNNDLLKVPFYILLQSLESSLLEKLNLNTDEIKLLDSQSRVKQLLHWHKARQKKDIHMEGVHGLYLSEILELSIKRKILDISLPLKHDLEDFRNRVSHADKSLLNDISEIPRLIKIKDCCLCEI
jgi:hypothetical protein